MAYNHNFSSSDHLCVESSKLLSNWCNLSVMSFQAVVNLEAYLKNYEKTNNRQSC